MLVSVLSISSTPVSVSAKVVTIDDVGMLTAVEGVGMLTTVEDVGISAC